MLVKRAEQAGYKAIALTVDTPINSPIERSIRHGSERPRGFNPGNFVGEEAGLGLVADTLEALYHQRPWNVPLTWGELGLAAAANLPAHRAEGHPAPPRTPIKRWNMASKGSGSPTTGLGSWTAPCPPLRCCPKSSRRLRAGRKSTWTPASRRGQRRNQGPVPGRAGGAGGPPPVLGPGLERGRRGAADAGNPPPRGGPGAGTLRAYVGAYPEPGRGKRARSNVEKLTSAGCCQGNHKGCPYKCLLLA